ncbi:hypothetical protein EDD17DRAFT_654287 [Pisolithus thermaeus]|nr:hypothetical protein EDD17DRAFT_654287 [Pisolithus thermaeus]
MWKHNSPIASTRSLVQWRLMMVSYPESSPAGAEVSEQMWRTIFNLCALSQFYGMSPSVFRLPTAWALVAVALKKIVLTANPEKA